MSASVIRPIEQRDNPVIARIVRDTLKEFGANHPGTVYYDASTDSLYELFRQSGSCYFIVEENDMVLGGAGLFPTEGLPDNTCELVKMYLLPEGRGKGTGKKLIQHCLVTAKEMGYEKVYLETMPELTNALGLYEKTGFRYLEAPLGNSGHFGCSHWMIRDL
ncbi:MAG: GNAT family N-acetyltransferase [Terrimonas ferruginea]|uniref:GNAT family N-acetyltransferase n=1 Tax=Terrimonas ferruginea TaxID=249 RepID=UPI00092A5613|nr:GNAT family N-acetyltransferase [Terrimonas ferruginea]MBN8781940.1 GNAT family N-acetyltransferase [Terrimonas ferruginea]OJW45074.1 MAG: GNAT family N-acetyltransferase [Sphingobacteriales bacterium 48-107]